jgi:hypothetical protein
MRIPQARIYRTLATVGLCKNGRASLKIDAEREGDCGNKASRQIDYAATTIDGGFQVPSRIETGPSLGQYRRSMTLNFALGAGSQFASLSCCEQRVDYPVSFFAASGH